MLSNLRFKPGHSSQLRFPNQVFTVALLPSPKRAGSSQQLYTGLTLLSPSEAGLGRGASGKPLTSQEAGRTSCPGQVCVPCSQKPALRLSGCCGGLGDDSQPTAALSSLGGCFVAEMRHFRPCASVELLFLGGWSCPGKPQHLRAASP